MRYKYLEVYIPMFLEFLKHGCNGIKLVSDGLPEDTTMVRAGYSHLGIMYLVLESKEWPELKEGEEILPVSRPMFEKMK